MRSRLRRWWKWVLGVPIVVLVLSHVIFGMPPTLVLRVMTDRIGPWHGRILRIERGYRHGLPVYLASYDIDDGYDDLYNVLGIRVCSPSGGLDGEGDGRCPEVADTVAFTREVWRAH